MGLKIINTGSTHGERKLSNGYFEGFLDTSNEWIKTRTGIESRYFVEKTENSTERLALEASKRLLDKVEVESLNLKLLMVASFTGGTQVPSMAARIQRNLNLTTKVFSVDINMACTGFVGMLIMAERYLEEGEQGLLVASEAISPFLDMKDRETCVLFGDGAGAVLVEKKEGVLFQRDMNTYGNYEDLYVDEESNVKMEGQNVYRFAIDKVPNSVNRVMGKAKLSPQDIDHVLSHQANLRILEQVSKKTNISMEKFHVNLNEYGNTSAASIPLLLDSVFPKIKAGEKVLITAFGAGLSVGSIVMEW